MAARYFDLPDLVAVGRRMIGTGLIGGKSAGMLLAHAILAKDNPAVAGRLGVYDSFFVGSDVYYTYLILNGCWWVRRRLKGGESVLETAQEARRRMLSGNFPDDIRAQFVEMLDRFTDAGFRKMEVTSFSNPKYLPQFADPGLELVLRDHKVVINARPIEEPRSWWLTLLLSFGPPILLIGAFIWISRRAAGQLSGSGVFGLGKSTARRVDQPEEEVRGGREVRHGGGVEAPAQARLRSPHMCVGTEMLSSSARSTTAW